ncbi:MAG: SRPBCC domain-containing protein [Acidobacteriota bacterium]
MSETTTAVFRIHIESTLETVWRELTRADGRPLPAFFNGVCDCGPGGMKVGAPLRIRTANGKYTSVVGEVTEFEPPTRYAHTFRFTQYDDPECTMVYELAEKDGGVELTLTALGVPAGTKTAGQIQRGGKMIVATLKRVVETGRPSFGTRLLYVLFKVLEPLTPSRLKSENWP